MRQRRRLLRGSLYATLLEEGERRHPGRDRRLERLAEERAERDVLPGLDVARTPVVHEHDAEDVVGEAVRRHAPAVARNAHDESELELEVEATRWREHRRFGTRRHELPAWANDVGAGDDDRAGAPVVAHRHEAPARRQMQSRLGERHARPVVRSRSSERVGPSAASEREQLVERVLREDVAERRQIDRLATVAPADARRAPVGREDAEAGHGGQRYTACRRAPHSGSLRTASDPGGSSAKHSLPGVRPARLYALTYCGCPPRSGKAGGASRRRTCGRRTGRGCRGTRAVRRRAAAPRR